MELFVGRATTLFVLVVLMLGLLVYRLLELQLWNHDTYKSRSDDNRIRVQTLAPPRGLIFDRDGRLLADNQNASSLGLVVDKMPEPTASIKRIASMLELSDSQQSEIIARVASNRRPDAPLVVVDHREFDRRALLRHHDGVRRADVPGPDDAHTFCVSDRRLRRRVGNPRVAAAAARRVHRRRCV